MTTHEGTLKRNKIGRWEIEDLELTSGHSVDLLIGGHWLKGHIEFWTDDYYWFSLGEGIPVVLGAGVRVRASSGRSTNF